MAVLILMTLGITAQIHAKADLKHQADALVDQGRAKTDAKAAGSDKAKAKAKAVTEKAAK